jgi:hypothetical protein
MRKAARQGSEAVSERSLPSTFRRPAGVCIGYDSLYGQYQFANVPSGDTTSAGRGGADVGAISCIEIPPPPTRSRRRWGAGTELVNRAGGLPTDRPILANEPPTNFVGLGGSTVQALLPSTSNGSPSVALPAHQPGGEFQFGGIVTANRMLQPVTAPPTESVWHVQLRLDRRDGRWSRVFQPSSSRCSSAGFQSVD